MSGWTGPMLGTGATRTDLAGQHGGMGLAFLRRPLTARERDVLLAASRGLNSDDTGRFLGISGQTVQTHRQTIRTKLHVHTIAAACSLALREGWIH